MLKMPSFSTVCSTVRFRRDAQFVYMSLRREH